MRMSPFAILLFLCAPVCAEPWLVVDDLQGTIPKAPKMNGDGRGQPLCKGESRSPEDATDQALTIAGWLLWGKPQRHGDTVIHIVAPALDGQCRPMGSGLIVFASGLPAVSYFPSSPYENLKGELRDNLLAITQAFAKPGEGACCKTGKRELIIYVKSNQ